MRRNRPWKALLSLLLAILCIPSPGAARAAAQETEGADYIVKFREDSARLAEDDRLPFEVVSVGEMRRLREEGLLEWYEEDGEAVLLDGGLCGSLSPYYEDDQRNLALIGADAAFQRGYLGQNVRVGVLDSGVNPHPALAASLLPGRNYMADAADPTDTADNLGHGTRVAGLIAGADETGYLGVAPGAKIVPLKITEGNSVKISAICAAIYGAIDDFGCQVLNLSLGVTSDYHSLREAIAYAEQKKAVVVSAAGNGGGSTLYYPAGYDTVIGVGSVDDRGVLYGRSNHNRGVFLTAPGVEVRTTAAAGGYAGGTGTSFSVPQVAGAAAVLLGIDPTLAPGRIMRLMAETATDQGAEGYDEYYGYGILNLAGCVAELTGALPAPVDPDPEPEPDPPQEDSYLTCARDSSCVLWAYSDLGPGKWYHDGVHWALENGVMNGYGGGKFGPNDTTTRAQVVQMLWSLEGKPAVNHALTFRDVEMGRWYTEAIRWAAAAGIVGGYSAERFGPNDPVSREQLATILRQYAGHQGLKIASAGKTSLAAYADAGEISRWANDGMLWAVSSGLISGVGNRTLSPKTAATRAQVATMLMHFQGLAA